MTDDLYKTLGVPKNATKDEIKRARKLKAQKLHPDRNNDPNAATAMTAVNAAADVLEDDEKRARYDQTGQTNRQPSRQQEARKAVMMFMNEALQQPTKVNVPNFVLQRLRERGPAIQEEINARKKHLAMLTGRLTEVTTDDPDNIFAGLLDGFIRETQHVIDQANENLETLKLAIEIALRYKSDVTVP